MGVYIKGIKTSAIVKVHYLNGRRYVEDPQSGEWREMVDIPPHGRLIDADAYIAYCGDKWIPLNIDAVNAQPTIIPAELPKEDNE